MYFYFSEILNARVLLVMEYLYTMVSLLLLKHVTWKLLPPLIGGVLDFTGSVLYPLLREDVLWCSVYSITLTGLIEAL